MSRIIISTFRPWTTVSALAFASLVVSVNTASAQPSRFSIDLREVGKLYDTRFRDRVTDEVTDSVIVYDYKSVPFGALRYKVPHFLTTDTGTTRKVVDYLAVPGYRTIVTVPNTAFFETTEKQAGELVLIEPRDYTIPDLQFDIRPMEEVADELSVASRQQLWRESVRAKVSALSATGDAATTGGIKFEIPLPMPKQLESIFGPGEKTSITLRGREEITIAGETNVVDPFLGAEGRQSQSYFPSLDMQQKLDVSLTGTIGDKVSIQVDHSSEAVTEDANRVRLAYTGYEDEVIQLIELGNTSLSLPGSQLVSVSTNAQGLFGAKMLAKMGSTDITVIASKQEGEVSSAQFSPGTGGLGQAELREIRDVDYVRGKYFYFDIDSIRAIPTLLPDEATVKVYRQLLQQDDPAITRFPGFAIPDNSGTGAVIQQVADILAANGTPPETQAQSTQFELLEFGTDYNFITDANTQQVLGIELTDAIPPSTLKSIGISYVNEQGDEVGGTFASLGVVPAADARAGNLLLKMIKAPDPDPNQLYASTWELGIRRIYNMGLNDIDGRTLRIEIIDNLDSRLNREFPDSSTVKYLQIFGLDQTDVSGTGESDGLVDLTVGLIDLRNGLIIFESDTPFHPAPELVAEYTNSTFAFTGPFQEQYDLSDRIYTEKLNTIDEEQVHQYIIRVEAVSTSKTFRINALNIVEQSERITLDGRQLARGTDYEIDYITGEVTLKDSAIAQITADSRITIDYQFKPLGGVASSTLAGLSSASKFGENARFGTTFLYESRSSSQDKARLGEEPTRAIVGGVTASYQHQSRILTDIANWLPFVDTDQPSTFQIDGEVAGSLPNPNTQNEAYIDDFEGVEDTDRIGLARRSWYQASLPLEEDNQVKANTARANFYWYNIEPEFGLHRRDLNPTLDEQENTLLQSLDVELEAAPTPDDTTTYAGVMLGFQGGGLDITQGQFLEIWVNDFKPDPIDRGGKLRIDLGIIDENFFRPDTTLYHDEDKNFDGFAAGLDDSGLDGLFNEAREGVPAEPSLPGGTPDDPSGDDIDLSRINGRFSRVNGTEANLTYDTEDLDRNGQLGRVNAYFSYEINLADSAEIDIRRQYPGYDGFTEAPHVNDAWRLYRIKLDDFTVRATGAVQPSLDEIKHVRIWFDDMDEIVRPDGVGRLRFQIAEFSIEGNRWEIDGIRNLDDAIASDTLTTEFAIGVISTKTDPGVYLPPVNPNVQNEISDKESSLALRYTNLGDTTQVRILKRFVGAGLNMTLYRDLNFWVHTDQLQPNMEYYFRMGTNETNYYEIAVPFTPEFYNETGWARVVINLSDLTNLKFSPIAEEIGGLARDIADPSRAYPVKMRGAPNLNAVRFLYAGVRNRNFGGGPQTGEVWINDIFLGDVMRDFDHAERVSANLSLAGGAISVGGNWARTGADYRGLRQTRGAGSDQTVLGLNAKTDLQYFFPLFGFSLPVAGNYSHSKALPKFPPNNDTEITDAAVSDSLKTVRITRGFNVSLARRNPSNNFLMRYTVDRIRPTFAYSDARGTSPASRDTTTSMQGSITYQMTWSGTGNTIPMFGRNRFRWWINQLDLSSSATRQTGKRWSYINGAFRRDPYQYAASMRNQGTVRYNPFRSLESSFSMGITRDLGIDHYWKGYNVGMEIARSNALRVSFVSPDWRILQLFEKPSVEVQTNYSEDSGPNVRREGDPNGTRNVSASRNDSGRIGFDVGKQFDRLFKLFGWDVQTPPPQPGGGGGSPGGFAGGAGAPPDTNVVGGVPAPPDTARAQSAPRERPSAGSFLRGVGRIFTTIRPLKGNVQHRKSSSYLRIPDRPDWSYQLGIDNNTGILVNGESIGPPENKQTNLSYNVESGVQLRENFDVQGRYTQAISDNDFRANSSRSTSTTWPDLQGRWGGLEKMRVLDQSIAQGELRVDWRETRIETGPKELPPITITETFTLTPALVLVWKNQINSSLNVSYNTNTSETQGSRSVTSNTAVGLELKKTFRGGGGFKIFGKGFDWRNEMEATLQVAYARTGGERFAPGSTLPEPIPRTTSLSVDPLVRYTFSKNISGSAFVGFGRSYLEQTGQTTTTVRLGVTAVINF